MNLDFTIFTPSIEQKPIILAKKKKHKSRWRYYYWLMVLVIFVALIFLVRFVLNSSKIYVDKSTAINPYYIEWDLERDGSLRINEPYFLNTKCVFIEKDLDKLKVDSSIYTPLILNPKFGGTLQDIEKPYLIWKLANNDTVHVLKNNILLNFKLKSRD